MSKINQWNEFSKFCVFLAPSGASAMGLNMRFSKREESGIFVTPTNTLVGLNNNVPELIHLDPHEFDRSAFVVDTKLFEVGHFLRQCVKGNPNIIALLAQENQMPKEHISSVFGSDVSVNLLQVFDSLVADRQAFNTSVTFNSLLKLAEKELKSLSSLDDTLDEQKRSRVAKSCATAINFLLTAKTMAVKGEFVVMHDCVNDLIAIRLEKSDLQSALSWAKQLQNDCKQLPLVQLPDEVNSQDFEKINDLLIELRRICSHI